MNSDERTTLVQFLDYYRSVLERKVAGLSDPQAREAAVPPSSLTLLGLLGHAAYLERYWFRVVFHGEDIDLIFDFTDDPDADLHPAADVTVTDELDRGRPRPKRGATSSTRRRRWTPSRPGTDTATW